MRADVQERQRQIAQARAILRSLGARDRVKGARVAARYLQRRGWSLEATFWILFRKAV